MKKSTIAMTVALGVFNLGLYALDKVAAKHAKTRAAVKAIDIRTPEQAEAFKEARERCDIFKQMADRESREVNHRLKDWKEANEYNKRQAEITNAIEDGLDEFKKQIGYSDKIADLDEKFDVGVESFKKSIDYDSIKSKMEETAEEAKKHYEQQKAAFDLAGDDISDTTMKLRHAAEEAMESKVKECKEKISALDKQLEAETDKLKKVKQEGIRNLEEKVSNEKIRLTKKQTKDLEKLDQELDSAKSDILKKVRKDRTNSEVAASDSHEDDLRVIREQKELDKKMAADILERMPKNVRIAEFLKAKKVPKWAVYILAILPAIPIGIILANYCQFVGGIIDAM